MTDTLVCATCALPLRRLESLEAIRSWTCDACKGIAAETAFLHGAVPTDRIVALEENLSKAAAGDRKCPKCRAPMRRATVRGGYGKIEIDGCGACRITWFDRGELHSFRTTTASGAGPPPSSMTPEERRAWRVAQLRAEATVTEDQSAAAIVGLVLGIPLPDHVEGQGSAYMTWAIGLITTATSLIALGDLHGAALRWGVVPDAIRSRDFVGLLTHFFVHADVFHLVGNLAFFLVFGCRVEALIGRVRFGALILAATIVGGLVHTVLAPDPGVPLIGASGGISGILAAYVCLRPKSKVRIMILYQIVPVPASVFMGFWVVLQVLGTMAQLSHMSAVSALAHLGGAAAGVVLGFGWRGRAAAKSALAVVGTP